MLGGFVVFVVGAVVGAAGLVLACLARNYLIAVIGFGLVGAGLANCIPLIFSAAARQSGIGLGRAIASVASAGYFGLFAGPPIIGSIAQLIGLQRALLLVAVAIILTLLLTKIGLGADACRRIGVSAFRNAVESKKRLLEYVSRKPAIIGLQNQYVLRLYSWAKNYVTVGTNLGLFDSKEL